MQHRDTAAETEFSVITMDEDVEASLKEAALISMGTEISNEDMANIVELCNQVQCTLPPIRNGNDSPVQNPSACIWWLCGFELGLHYFWRALRGKEDDVMHSSSNVSPT